jgi:RNA processing factor Prp31
LCCSREWYSYHFPELVKIVPENYMYARVAQFIKNRKELTPEHLEGLEEIVMDSAKAQTILDAARSSMGNPLNTTTEMIGCIRLSNNKKLNSLKEI